MRFELIVKPIAKQNRNFELVRSTIPQSIQDKIETYKPTDDLQLVEFIDFKIDLTLPEKTQLLNLFPELKEV